MQAVGRTTSVNVDCIKVKCNHGTECSETWFYCAASTPYFIPECAVSFWTEPKWVERIEAGWNSNPVLDCFNTAWRFLVVLYAYRFMLNFINLKQHFLACTIKKRQDIGGNEFRALMFWLYINYETVWYMNRYVQFTSRICQSKALFYG